MPVLAPLFFCRCARTLRNTFNVLLVFPRQHQVFVCCTPTHSLMTGSRDTYGGRDPWYASFSGSGPMVFLIFVCCSVLQCVTVRKTHEMPHLCVLQLLHCVAVVKTHGMPHLCVSQCVAVEKTHASLNFLRRSDLLCVAVVKTHKMPEFLWCSVLQ